MPGYPIGSVDKALRLLLLFRERSTLRLSEAAAEIGVAVSTAHRLLAMLQFHGFVFQDERSRLYVSSMDLRSVARPHLERLCFEVDETVHIAILEGAHVRYVDSAEPSKPLRVASRTGQRLPAHATAVGKLLLSYLEPAQLEALLPGRLEGLTPRTVTSRTKLVCELKERRAQGWAQNTGEAEEDISSIAVAIVDERVGARAR